MPAPIPGQPHPDVAIVESVLRERKPGDVIPYAEIAKALGLRVGDPVVMRRCTAARKRLAREGIVISCQPGTGLLIETSEQTRLRVGERETRAIRRKAAKNVLHLSSIKAAELDHSVRTEFWALVAVNKVVQAATTHQARQRLIGATSVASAEVAVTKALEVLQERNGETGKE